MFSMQSTFANESVGVPHGALRYSASVLLLKSCQAATGADIARPALENKGHSGKEYMPPLPPPSVTTPIKKPSSHSHISLQLKQSSSTTLWVPRSLGYQWTLSQSTHPHLL